MIRLAAPQQPPPVVVTEEAQPLWVGVLQWRTGRPVARQTAVVVVAAAGCLAVRYCRRPWVWP